MRARLSALRCLHPFPSLLVAALTAALVPLADPAAPATRYVALGLGMLLYQFAIGLVNDLLDISEDRRTKPWKPLASGAVSVPLALAAAVACVLGALALTSALSLLAWLVGVAGLACGLSYDLYFKRTTFSWLPYAVALPLVPVWVFVASEAWRPLLWWSFPLGALLGLALNLANEAPDVAHDHRRGLPGRLGEQRSRVVAVVLFGVVAGLLAALLVTLSLPPGLGALVIGGAAVAVSPWSTRFLGRDGLFGLLAAASAALAVLFFSSV